LKLLKGKRLGASRWAPLNQPQNPVRALSPRGIPGGLRRRWVVALGEAVHLGGDFPSQRGSVNTNRKMRGRRAAGRCRAPPQIRLGWCAGYSPSRMPCSGPRRPLGVDERSLRMDWRAQRRSVGGRGYSLARARGRSFRCRFVANHSFLVKDADEMASIGPSCNTDQGV